MEEKNSGYQLPLTIREAIASIHRKDFLFPAIQREFVWSEKQIIRLFDSLMRKFPIGSFLFWNVNKQNIENFEYYEFIRNYHERDNFRNPKANVTGEKAITAILDGQQRLTSLYIALKGNYASKIPRRRWDNDDAFPKKKLYLNLLLGSKDFDLKYDFRFLSEEDLNKFDSNFHWFEVGEVLKFQNFIDINNYLRANNLVSNNFADKCLLILWQILTQDKVLTYYEETSQELDKVLNIFIRVNSGGTQLSYSDLLLSIATAKWDTKDAREEITSFVDNVNRIGETFKFSKDFVLKSCLVLSDIKDIAFKVDNFNNENMGIIENKWNKIKKALKLAIELIANYGYNYRNLVSTNAIIPIAYYIMQKGNPDNFITNQTYKRDRYLIKKWFNTSLIKRAFSGSPDNVLRPIRKILNEKDNRFPLGKIYEQFKATNRTLIFNEDELDSLITYKYNQKHTFAILSLLYEWISYRNRFHMDHIFPRSLFTRRKLSRRGFDDKKIEFYLDNYDYIGNLQLLEGFQNEEKSSKEFKVWFNEMIPIENDKKIFMNQHYIPDNISLDFDNFEEFINNRKMLLRNKFVSILRP